MCASMDVESMRAAARAQTKIYDAKVHHLEELLTTARRERDAAREECVKLQQKIIRSSSGLVCDAVGGLNIPTRKLQDSPVRDSSVPCSCTHSSNASSSFGHSSGHMLQEDCVSSSCMMSDIQWDLQALSEMKTTHQSQTHSKNLRSVPLICSLDAMDQQLDRNQMIDNVQHLPGYMSVDSAEEETHRAHEFHIEALPEDLMLEPNMDLQEPNMDLQESFMIHINDRNDLSSREEPPQLRLWDASLSESATLCPFSSSRHTQFDIVACDPEPIQSPRMRSGSSFSCGSLYNHTNSAMWSPPIASKQTFPPSIKMGSAVAAVLAPFERFDDFRSSVNASTTPLPLHLPEPPEADPEVMLRSLPEKGKLLQAVMQAGPLLQTLLLAGPLPQWRHPPPSLDTLDIPRVSMPTDNAQRLHPITAPACQSNPITATITTDQGPITTPANDYVMSSRSLSASPALTTSNRYPSSSLAGTSPMLNTSTNLSYSNRLLRSSALLPKQLLFGNTR